MTEERIILFNVLLFLVWSAIAYLIWRYRIHIHVSYEPRPMARKPVRKPAAIDRSAEREIADTLVALGCTATRAKSVAARVVPIGGDFDSMLRRAIQEAS